VSKSNNKYFTVLILFLSFILNYSVFAQQNFFNKDAELHKFVERGGKVELVSPNVYELTYQDGTSRVYNFNISVNQNNFQDGFENTIINVWEIDTTLYEHKFRFWQKVDIVNAYEGIVFVEDLNLNKRLELYGYSEENYPFNGPVVIFEQNGQGTFNKIFTYDSNTVFVQGVGDVDSDGKKEIHLRTNDTLNGKFYKSDSLGLLPTTFDFIFYYYPNQIQDEIFNDFDKNKITDCAFVDGSNPSKVVISEYRNNLNNFTSRFEMTTEGDVPSGFAVGDFDQDSKNEIVFSTVLQKVYVVEVVDTNQYSLVWQGSAPTYNAYMITATNDIDGNGKPEFWVGGQDFNTGISTFWCYEADENNSYIPIAGIELRYLVTLDVNYLQSADINNDGKEELIINLDNYLLILQFDGEPNQHSYKIFYAKIDEHSQPGANFRPVTIADLNNDGAWDILLPMDKYINPNTALFSYLLVQDTVTSVKDDEVKILNEFSLCQNYPNPFNPSTKIKFTIPTSPYPSPYQGEGTRERFFVTLKVYDVLGKEISTLVNEEKPAGEYEVEFNAKGLPSGIYFYQLKAGDPSTGSGQGFVSTKKMILLK
ncbi:MAG: T9SS type A sorting domain-containing protein, partial [Ignavibacteriaceae bacterium]|nr:T9SS type A sorting domain-containing protein [Ignavibacteriaceae bacterium]